MLFPSSPPLHCSEIHPLTTPVTIRHVTYTHHVGNLMTDSYESALIAKSLFERLSESMKNDIQLAVKEGVFFCINNVKEKYGSWSINQDLRQILRTSPADIGLPGRKNLPLDGIVITIHTGEINSPNYNILELFIHELKHHYYFLFNMAPFDCVLKKHHMNLSILDTFLADMLDPFLHRARNVDEQGRIHRSLLTSYFDDLRTYYQSNPTSNYFKYQPYHPEVIFTAPYLYFENNLVQSFEQSFSSEELKTKLRKICKEEFEKYFLDSSYQPLAHLAKQLKALFPGFANKYIRSNIASAMMYARAEIGPFFAQVESTYPGLTLQMAPNTVNLLKRLDNSEVKMGPLLSNFAAYMAANAEIKPLEKVNNVPFANRVLEHHLVATPAGHASNYKNVANRPSQIPIPKKIDNRHSGGPHVEDTRHLPPSKKTKISLIEGLPGDPSFRGLRYAAADSTFCYGFSKTADGFFIYTGKLTKSASQLPQMKVIRVPDSLGKAVQAVYEAYPKIEKGIKGSIRIFNIVFYGLTIASETLKTYQEYDVTLLEAISHATKKLACSEAVLAVSSLFVGGPTAFILFALAELSEMSPDLRAQWESENQKIEQLMQSPEYNNLPLNVRHIWLRDKIQQHPYADPSILISDQVQRFLKNFSFEGISRQYNTFVLEKKKRDSAQPLTALQRAEILRQIEELLSKDDGKGEQYSLLGLDHLRAWDNEKIFIPNPGGYLGLPEQTSAGEGALPSPNSANGLLAHIAQNPPKKKDAPLAWLSSKNNRRPSPAEVREVERDMERRFTMPKDNSPMDSIPPMISIPIKNPNGTTPNIDMNIQIDIPGIVDHIIKVCKKEKIDSDDVKIHGDIYHYTLSYHKSDEVLILVKDPSGHYQRAIVELKKFLGVPLSSANKDNQESILKKLKNLLEESVSGYIGSQVSSLQNTCMEAFKKPESCLQSIIQLTHDLQKKYPGEEFKSIKNLCHEYVNLAIKAQAAQTPINASNPTRLEGINNKVPDLKPLSTFNEMSYRLHLPVSARRGKNAILGEGEPASRGDVNVINQQFKNLFNGKNILQVDRNTVASFIEHLDTVYKNWNRVTQYADDQNKHAEHDKNIKALSTYIKAVKGLYQIICSTQDTFQTADLVGFMGQLASLSKAPNTFVEEVFIQGMQQRINEILQSNDVDRIVDLKLLVENPKICEVIPTLAQYDIQAPLSFAQFTGVLLGKKLSETMLYHFKRGQFATAKNVCQSTIAEKKPTEEAHPILALYQQYLNQSFDDAALAELTLSQLSYAFIHKHEGSEKEMTANIKNFFFLELIKYFGEALDKICNDDIPEQFRRVAAKDVVSIAELIDKEKDGQSTGAAVDKNAPLDVLAKQSPKILALFNQCGGNYAWMTLWIRWEKAHAILNNSALSEETREKAFRNLDQMHLDSLNLEQNDSSISHELRAFILATKNYHNDFINVHGDLKLFFECHELYQLFNRLEDKNRPTDDKQAVLEQIHQKTQSIVPRLKEIPTTVMVDGKFTQVFISNPLSSVLQREIDRFKRADGKISIYTQIVELDNMVMTTLGGQRESEQENFIKMYEMAKKVKENCSTPEGKEYCDEIIAIKYRNDALHYIQPVTNSFLYAFSNISTRWGSDFIRGVSVLLQCIQTQLPSVLPDLFILPYAISCQDNWQYMFQKNVDNQLAQYQKCLNNPFKNLENFIGVVSVASGALNVVDALSPGTASKLTQFVATPLKIAQLGYYYSSNRNDVIKSSEAKNNLKLFALDSFTDLALSIYEFIYSDPELDEPSIVFSMINLMMQKLGKKINRKPGYLSQLPAEVHFFPDMMKLLLVIFSKNRPLLILQGFKLIFNVTTGQYLEGYIQYALKDAKYFLKKGDLIKCEDRVEAIKKAIESLTNHLPAIIGYNAKPKCYSNNDSQIIKAAKSFIITFYAAKFTNEGHFNLVKNLTDFCQENGQFILQDAKVPLSESVSAMIYRLRALIQMKEDRVVIRSECAFLEKYYRELYKNKMDEPAVKKIFEQFSEFKNLFSNKKTGGFEMSVLLKYQQDLYQQRKPKKYPTIKDEAHDNPQCVREAGPASNDISPDF